MAYAEESIIVNELSASPPDVRRRAFAVTGLDLVDQVKLHKFGLLDVPEDTSIDWTSFILDSIREYDNNIAAWAEEQ